MFCDILKKLRKQSGYSQAELANHLGVAKSTISMYEVGNRTPDYEMLKSIAIFFNVDINTLFGSETPKKENPAEGEIAEDVVIYHRDGKTVRRTFTKDQLDMITKMLDAIPDKPKDI